MAPDLNTYMGTAFEGIVREAYARLHERWTLAEPRLWSRQEGSDRNRRSVEIDIVADLVDGSLLRGEIEWSSKAADHDLHVHLMRDLEDLARSGRGWARKALSRKGVHLYVSAAGFTEHFQPRVAEDGRIRLLSLEDLY